MLTEHRSDPNDLTFTPQTRRRRKLRRQKTAIPTRLSNNEGPQPGSSIYQILVNTKSRVQGIGYNMKSFLFDDSRPIVFSEYSRLWLSGERIVNSESFYERWSQINRMTYRRKWPEPILNPRSLIFYDSDTGWGCTVRSSQMLVAHAMKRLDFPPSRVWECFLDRPGSVLSVHSFVRSQTDKLAGEWFGPSSATRVVCKILSSSESLWLNLGVFVSFDGRLSAPGIVEQSRAQMGSSFGSWSIDTPPVATTCKKSTVANSWELLCNETNICCPSSLSGCSSLAPSPRDGFVDLCHSHMSTNEFLLVEEDDGMSVASSSVDRLPVVVVQSQDVWSRPVLVMVAVRLSPGTELSAAQTAALLSYMTLPSFVGIIGGPDKRCHFIVGLLEESNPEGGSYELLSMDPHIVQEAVTGDDSTLTTNPFENAAHPTRLSPSCLCPSLALSFLLRSQTDLDVLTCTLSTSMAGGFIELLPSGGGDEEERPHYTTSEVAEGEPDDAALVLVSAPETTI